MEKNEIVYESHKHQKLVEALRANSINQEDPVSEWIYVKYTDLSGAKGVTKCLCTTPIAKFHTIQNIHTKKDEIIGSECILRFMENTILCDVCKKKLRNLGERLNTGNFVCPSCTRIRQAERAQLMKKYGNYKYYHKGHPYNNMKFKDIVDGDLSHMAALMANPRTEPATTGAQALSYKCLMEYVNYHCVVIEEGAVA